MAGVSGRLFRFSGCLHGFDPPSRAPRAGDVRRGSPTLYEREGGSPGGAGEPKALLRDCDTPPRTVGNRSGYQPTSETFVEFLGAALRLETPIFTRGQTRFGHEAERETIEQRNSSISSGR